MSFIRARGEEQKAQRIQEIIGATLKIYEEEGYDAVTFSKIGKGLNFSRINLYNYFKCKEDIFLLILLQEIRTMVDDAAVTFRQPPESIDAFVEQWAELMLRHERMMTLFCVLNTIILRGAEDEPHMNFRSKMFVMYRELRDIVRRALPQLTQEQAMEFVEYENSYAMTIFSASMEYKKSQHISIFPKAGYGTGPFLPQFRPFLYCILKGIMASS